SWVQPDVPVVIAKVWLPDVPLVVTARTWGAMPLWPSNNLAPQPQVPMLFCWANANAGTADITTAIRIFLIYASQRIEETTLASGASPELLCLYVCHAALSTP